MGDGGVNAEPSLTAAPLGPDHHAMTPGTAFLKRDEFRSLSTCSDLWERRWICIAGGRGSRVCVAAERGDLSAGTFSDRVAPAENGDPDA